MNKLYIFFLFLILSNCSLKPVVKHHGVPLLDKKNENLFVNKTNRNDIIKLLGTPSTKSKFNNDIWIYIERKQTQTILKNLGRMKIYKNNVLVLEIDKYGILKKKEFFNQNDMNKLTITGATTDTTYRTDSFIYELLSSMRQKVNDPLGVRAKKRKEISQR
ncbi:outer membrane protein assembly factor BamE domain-containing protein [Candidatus Pelagibacter sp. HIMB1715]|uniref:outer membrane protein assembly factor BamE domain-containing protein n=1 Tax=Candidatus Pelagibacter sp. HIMB1715 TaxID=3413369 RepID=UPI003F82BC91